MKGGQEMVSAFFRTVEREQNRDPVMRAYVSLAAAVIWQAALDVWTGPGETQTSMRTRDYRQAKAWLFSPGYEVLAAALGFDPDELREYILHGDRRGIWEHIADLKERAEKAGRRLVMPWYGDRRSGRVNRGNVPHMR